MSLACGIVGLPNVGKSTLFNVLTSAGALVGNFPFTTVAPNVGVAPVADPRLDRLFEIFRPARKVHASCAFVDIAGLIAGASKGEGLGNQFLGHIREADAVLHVLRCFSDPDVTHVSGSADPARDAGVVETELALADLSTVERRLERAEKAAKSGDAKLRTEASALDEVRAALSGGTPLRAAKLSSDAAVLLPTLHLLSAKPVLYVANVGEKGHGSDAEAVASVRSLAEAEGAGVVVLSCKLEAEISELAEAERGAFLAEVGLAEPGIVRLVREAYRLLGLITFFTGGGETEVRAWPVEDGAQAPQAAGKIHSDMEKGFIRAEVVAFDDLDRAGGIAAAREAGKLRLEGKEYRVRDGDLMTFRFSS